MSLRLSPLSCVPVLSFVLSVFCIVFFFFTLPLLSPRPETSSVLAHFIYYFFFIFCFRLCLAVLFFVYTSCGFFSQIIVVSIGARLQSNREVGFTQEEKHPHGMYLYGLAIRVETTASCYKGELTFQKETLSLTRSQKLEFADCVPL